MFYRTRIVAVSLSVLLLMALTVPLYAQIEEVSDIAVSFMEGMQSMLQAISVIAVAVSALTLGLIYVLSTWPPVAQYKAQHPDLMQNLIVGCCLIAAVGSGVFAFVSF
jgi:hypothetical protein